MKRLTLSNLFICLGIFVCFSILNEVKAQKFPKPPTKPIVKGQIINKENSPIPGATVIVKGTTTGTVSDINGFFQLDLTLFTEKEVTLVLDFLGTARKEMEVILKDLPKSYGQIKLKDATF